jgi:hypothetical protein
MAPQKGRHFESYDHLYDLWMRCWIDESLFSSDPSLFEMGTHRFLKLGLIALLKWGLIAFSNGDSLLFQMRIHCFFKWGLIAFWNEDSSLFLSDPPRSSHHSLSLRAVRTHPYIYYHTVLRMLTTNLNLINQTWRFSFNVIFSHLPLIIRATSAKHLNILPSCNMDHSCCSVR